jgi:hypothetical protein
MARYQPSNRFAHILLSAKRKESHLAQSSFGISRASAQVSSELFGIIGDERTEALMLLERSGGTICTTF